MNSYAEYYPKAREIADKIFNHPELGWKEHATSELVEAEIQRLNPNITIEHFCGTGLQVRFDQGRDRTIAFIAELDAVYQPHHPQADPDSGAAHACGHFTQTTVALSLIHALSTTDALSQFTTNVVFIFVPAEEYVDLPYRQQLRAAGKITYFGGKPEAMKRGVFDDIDLAVCIHAIGEEFTKRTVELNCDLAGFNFKYYDFNGRASHAGFDPFSGVNAYSISSLFDTATGMLRQQVKDTELIRFNPVMIDADMSINVIPDHVKIGTDVRYLNLDYANTIMGRLDHAALGAAQALGGSVDITTEVGYLPFRQNHAMNAQVKAVYDETPAIEDIITDRGAIAAAGDIGDLGFMLPSIQISHGGFHGTIHGADFQLVDPEFVLQILPEFVMHSMQRITQHLDTIDLYHRPYADYAATLAKMEATAQ